LVQASAPVWFALDFWAEVVEEPSEPTTDEGGEDV
jgi:hypothetical protein